MSILHTNNLLLPLSAAGGAAPPFPTDALAYFKLDEGSGATLGNSGSGADGGVNETYNDWGGTGYFTTDGGYIASNVGDNAAGNGYLGLGNDNLDVNNDFSICHHAQFFDVYTSVDFYNIIGKGTSENNNNNYFQVTAQRADGSIFSRWRNNEAITQQITATTTLANAQKYHVGLTYDNTAKVTKLYVNGVLEKTKENSDMANTIANSTRVGNIIRSSDVNSPYRTGPIMTFTRVLSDAEMAVIAAHNRNYTP